MSGRSLLYIQSQRVAAMAKAGVPRLAGTDVLNPFVLPGF